MFRFDTVFSLSICALLANDFSLAINSDPSSANDNTTFKHGPFIQTNNQAGSYHSSFVEIHSTTVPLGLYKTYIENKFGTSPSLIFWQQKASSLNSLKCCGEELNLAQPDAQSMLYCKSVQEHLWDVGSIVHKAPKWTNKIDNTCPMGYTRQASFKIKSKTFLSPEFKRLDFEHYRLDPQLVKREAKRIFADNNMPQGFGIHQEDFGFYGQAERYHGSFSVQCKGKLFISVNMSGAPDYFSKKIGYEFDYTEYVVDRMNDGVLFKFKDLECGLLNRAREPGVSAKFDLAIIKRREFPYFSLDSHISSQPFASIGEFFGSLKQHRDNQSSNAFSTNIKLRAVSELFFGGDIFKSEHTFVNNENGVDGSELFLYASRNFNAIVKGNWSEGIHVKSLDVIQQLGVSMRKIIKMFYINSSDEDYIKFEVFFEKKILKNLLAGNFDDFKLLEKDLDSVIDLLRLISNEIKISPTKDLNETNRIEL